MKTEILKHKVVLYYGTIHRLKADDRLKESNFSVRDNLIFDKMFQNFVKHDHKIIA